MKKRTVSRMACVFMTLVLVFPVLSACIQGEITDDNQDRVLRIATFWGGDEQYFRTQFTHIFEYAHPNIKVEIVPVNNDYRYGYRPNQEERKDPVDQLIELMNGANPPDVVVFDYSQLSRLVQENMLAPLDSRMTEDEMDINEFVPSVISAIKSVGNDQLYALAPTFSGSALIYNKKLFLDAGVNPPAPEMTWDDLFNLARLMSRGEGDNRVYGFSFSPYSDENPYYELQTYTAPLQLSIMDEKGERMTVDSENWAAVWETVVSLKEDNVLPKRPERPMMTPEEFNPFFHDHFLSGRVAMTIAPYGYINQIIQANMMAPNISGFEPVEWDAVPLPTHPTAPGVGGNIYMNTLMGINARAQNPEDAWEYIKFVHSDEWARLRAGGHEMVTRVKYIQPKEGLSYNVEAFYALTPPPVMEMPGYFKDEAQFRVYDLGYQKFQEVLQGQKSVREALQEWQTEGDALLQEIKQRQQSGAPGEEGTGGAIPMPMDSIKAVQ